MSEEVVEPVAAAIEPDANAGAQAAPVSVSEGSEAPKTLASGAEPSEKETVVQANWPDDWRQRIAGNDEKKLQRLSRYSSFDTWAKAQDELYRKMSSGEYKRGLPEGASDDERATWRKESGIPESPDKYDISIGRGVVWGEADAPFLKDFTEYAHKNDMTPGEVTKALGWYHAMQERTANEREVADETYRATAEDELRQDWGGDFRRNMNAVSNLMSTFPKDISDSLLTARMPDGTVVGNNPGVLRELARLARELNPASTLVPVGTSDPVKSINQRVGELSAMMGDHSSAYWKGPQSSALQQEFRDLTEAMATMKARAA